MVLTNLESRSNLFMPTDFIQLHDVKNCRLLRKIDFWSIFNAKYSIYYGIYLLNCFEHMT